MKRGFLSTGILFLVLVGMLGALAVGYGLWSKTLTVTGTVNTGDFNADWDMAETSDHGLDPCTIGLNPTGCMAPQKDVGSCEVTGVGTQDLVITIDNAYPSYECTITAWLTNTGTIPFNVHEDAVIVIEPEADDVLDVECEPIIEQQVDPQQELELRCWVHVRQSAMEKTTYTASATLCVSQWNEDPSFEECVAAAGNSEPTP